MTLLVRCKISLFLLAIGCWLLLITCALSTFSTPETKTIKTTESGKQRPRTEWHHCHTGCQNETHSHHFVGLGRVSDGPACSFSVMLTVPTDSEGTRSMTERTSLAVGPCPFRGALVDSGSRIPISFKRKNGVPTRCCYIVLPPHHLDMELGMCDREFAMRYSREGPFRKMCHMWHGTVDMPHMIAIGYRDWFVRTKPPSTTAGDSPPNEYPTPPPQHCNDNNGSRHSLEYRRFEIPKAHGFGVHEPKQERTCILDETFSGSILSM